MSRKKAIEFLNVIESINQEIQFSNLTMIYKICDTVREYKKSIGKIR